MGNHPSFMRTAVNSQDSIIASQTVLIVVKFHKNEYRN